MILFPCCATGSQYRGNFSTSIGTYDSRHHACLLTKKWLPFVSELLKDASFLVCFFSLGRDKYLRAPLFIILYCAFCLIGKQFKNIESHVLGYFVLAIISLAYTAFQMSTGAQENPYRDTSPSQNWFCWASVAATTTLLSYVCQQINFLITCSMVNY